MSFEQIEALTKDYASARIDVLARATAVQDAIDAIHATHHGALRRLVERMSAAMQRLDEAIQASADLFPDGAKSVVIDGIKVGYQKGKDTVLLTDEAFTLGRLIALVDDESLPTYVRERLSAALRTKHSVVDAGLKRLSPAEQADLRVQLVPAADAVLIKPVDDEAMKTVGALIKLVMRETETESA
jgi:hypothetical protein